MLNIENIAFEKQFNGYDRTQVDRYVASITEAYQTAYDEYTAVCGKYNDLLEDYRRLEEKEQSKPSADIIAKTLVDTEALAQKIIADAKADAAVVTADARVNARKAMEDANAEAEAIQQKSSSLIEDAYLEAARITSQAQKDREEANTIVELTITRLQDMLEQGSSRCFAQSAENSAGAGIQCAGNTDIEMMQQDDAAVLIPFQAVSIGS